MRIDVASIRRHVEALKVAYPELCEDEQFLADVIEGETDVYEVLSILVRQANESKAQAGGLGEYAKDIGERKARIERRVEAKRALIMSIMDAAGISKATLPEATLSVRAGSQKAVVDDAAVLPDDLVRIERKPDMAAIKSAIDAGREVPGIHISNGEPSLTVRVK
jgi:hypothetical protein